MEIVAGNGRLGVRRLVLLVLLPAAVAGAAAWLLPSGLLRLAALALLAVPWLLLVLDRPALAFYLLVFVLFSNLDLFASFRLYRLTLVLAVFALAVEVVNGRRLVGHHPLLVMLAALFTIFMIQSVAVARDYEAASTELVRFLKTLLPIAIAFQFARDRIEFRRFALALAVAILVNDFAPLVLQPPSKLASLSMVWSQGVFRYEGFVFEPNQFAVIQLFLLPLLVYLIVAYRRRPPVAVFFSLAIAACVVVLTLSFSRGGFVGLAALIGVLLYVQRRNRRILAVGIVLVVAGLSLAPAIYWERIQTMLAALSGKAFDFSIFTRVESMKEAIRLGLQHPLFGIGVDNFVYAMGTSMPYQMIVHNTFLQVFADLGVIAFAGFMGIIVCNFIVMRNLMRRADLEATQLGRLLCVQHVAVLVGAQFIPVAYDPFFWFMLALPAIADYSWRGVPVIDRSPREAGSTAAA